MSDPSGLGSLYIWLEIASALVIFGVILEGHEFIEEIQRKGWRPIWPKLGFGILIIGLAGELLFQTKIESKDAALKRSSDNKIELLRAAAAPRELLQPKTFVLAFMAATGNPCISVNSYAFDAEGARLANEIINQLRSMSFAVADNTLTEGAQNPMAYGIYVSGPRADLVSELISWLNASHLSAVSSAPPPREFSFGGQSFTKCTAAAIVFVGAKPILPTFSN